MRSKFKLLSMIFILVSLSLVCDAKKDSKTGNDSNDNGNNNNDQFDGISFKIDGVLYQSKIQSDFIQRNILTSEYGKNWLQTKIGDFTGPIGIVSLNSIDNTAKAFVTMVKTETGYLSLAFHADVDSTSQWLFISVIDSEGNTIKGLSVDAPVEINSALENIIDGSEVNIKLTGPLTSSGKGDSGVVSEIDVTFKALVNYGYKIIEGGYDMGCDMSNNCSIKVNFIEEMDNSITSFEINNAKFIGNWDVTNNKFEILTYTKENTDPCSVNSTNPPSLPVNTEIPYLIPETFKTKFGKPIGIPIDEFIYIEDNGC